ncbi:MAG: hypothetical protein AAB116_06670 [Candidatus Poribacteria bacterium]
MSYRFYVLLCLMISTFGNPAIFANDAKKESAGVIIGANNPDPENLPTLGVWQENDLILVSAKFPNVPDFTCDSWCYESNVDFVDAKALGKGAIELRHRDRSQPYVLIITTVTPEPGAVEFSARIELDLDKYPDAKMPQTPTWLNLCWQLRRSPLFASKPDPYPEFVKRCFIFTENGMTFLDKTFRKKIPCRPEDDTYNNPPWVQMYVGAWQEIPEVTPESWADYSTDRYITTIIGAISRDEKYLTAIANDSATSMCQAWHDCMHNNPQWLPENNSTEERRWRLKIYAMENDSKTLLSRVAKDFPNVKHAYQAPGISAELPVFYEKLKDHLTFTSFSVMA